MPGNGEVFLREKGNHIIATAVEHQAVLATCNNPETIGYEVTRLPVDETGQLDLNTLEQSLLTGSSISAAETDTLCRDDKS